MNRPLSPIEHMMWQVDQIARQNFVFVARILGQISEETLRKALDVLQDKFSSLKIRIQDGAIPEYTTNDVPRIPLRTIAMRDEFHWQEEAEKEIDTVFPFKTGPLVRSVLLNSEKKSDLLLSFCHVPTDGISSLMVLDFLLKIIGDFSQGKPKTPLQNIPLSPASIDLLRKDLKYPNRSFSIIERIKKKIFKPVELMPEIDTPLEKKRSRFLFAQLSKEETHKLLYLAKKEKTTAHGAISAAFFQAIIEQIRSNQNVPQRGPLMLGCFSPVNIRQFFTRSVQEDIGYYISVAVHYQLINEHSSLWSVARKIIKSLKKEIYFGNDIKILFSVNDILKQISDPYELATSIHISNAPIVSTNLGRINLSDQYGDLKLEALYYPASIHFDAKSGLCLESGTFQDCLNLGFLYVEPIVSKKRAEQILSNMIERLKNAIK